MPKILPGNYNLQSLYILSDEGKKIVDLFALFDEINFFESIYTPVLTGYITVTDALNLISGVEYGLPIMGNEIVVVELTLPEYEIMDDSMKWEPPTQKQVPENTSIKRTMKFVGRVTDIKNKSLPTDRSQNYEIHFISEEGVLDRNLRVSKSYKSKTMQDIILDVFNTFNSDSSYEFEKTSNQFDVVVPDWNPFKTINWCASRSTSLTYNNNSTFFFYQTLYNDGETDLDRTSYIVSSYSTKVSSKYWFLSLDDMLAYDYKKRIFYRPSNVSLSQKDEKYNNMFFSNAKSYEVIHSFDTLEANDYGLFNSKYIYHDITKKQWKQIDYNYDSEFEKYQHTAENKIYSGTKDRFGKSFTDYKESRVFLNPFGTPESPNKLEQISSSRMNRIASLNSFKIRISLPGDGYLEAGDIIYFELPSPEPSGQSKFDEFYEGKYLITAIRHTFDNSEYSMSIECSKEALKKEVRGYVKKNA
jgi:hypothetical protein